MGVPQECPVTPIHFVLFTALLFEILTQEDKNAGVKIRGYVDDGLLTLRGQKRDVGAVKIQEMFIKVKAWATENSMVFDLAKFETIYFS